MSPRQVGVEYNKRFADRAITRVKDAQLDHKVRQLIFELLHYCLELGILHRSVLCDLCPSLTTMRPIPDRFVCMRRETDEPSLSGVVKGRST